ncbi:MAG: DUF2087 domain-containing protein [Chitinophagales bacterium]
MQSTKSIVLSKIGEQYKPIVTFFNEDLQIEQWPTKHSKKQLVLQYLITKFEADKNYSEKEVNVLLNQHHTFGDPALLRRMMFSSKLLDRTQDCRAYWVKNKININFLVQ